MQFGLQNNTDDNRLNDNFDNRSHHSHNSDNYYSNNHDDHRNRNLTMNTDRYDCDNRSYKRRDTSRPQNYYGPSQDYTSSNRHDLPQQSHSSKKPQYSNEEEKGRGYSESDYDNLPHQSNSQHDVNM